MPDTQDVSVLEKNCWLVLKFGYSNHIQQVDIFFIYVLFGKGKPANPMKTGQAAHYVVGFEEIVRFKKI